MIEWEVISQNSTSLGDKTLKILANGCEKESQLWGYLPVLTHESGLFLNQQDYLSLGLSTAVYNLNHLLIKPGEKTLNEAKTIAKLSGWQGFSILNAKFPEDIPYQYKRSSYHFKSPIDGARLSLTTENALQMAQHLKSDIMIPTIHLDDLKEREWRTLNQLIKSQAIPLLIDVSLNEQATILACDEQLGFVYDLYRNHTPAMMLEFLKIQARVYTHHFHYVMGNLNLRQILTLLMNGADMVESPLPLCDAVAGILYTRKKPINISLADFETDFNPIEERCLCYTCKNFTRAYLHHLHVQTPLLSHRLQIIHNLFHCIELVTKLHEFSCMGKLREFINTYMM
jgi:queuine tRNA-ribosyltransferase